MKHKFWLFTLILLAVTSCADDPLQPTPEGRDDVLSRGMVDRGTSSTSNPDLINDWENQTTIVLNTANALQQGDAVTAPWANGSSSQLTETFRKDIRKADGWKMIFHTFRNVGEDPKVNYMFFYNLFTGYVKVFYYYEGETGASRLNWHISANNKYAMFDNPEFCYLTSSDEPHTNHIIVNNATPDSRPTAGWNGFEFKVARYGGDLRSEDLNISPSETFIATMDFQGIEQSDVTGTITSVSSTDKEYIQSIANSAGAAAKSAVDKFADKNLKTSGIFDAAKIVASIGAGDYASALKSGLKFLFGSSMFTKTTYSTSDVKLKSTGTMTLGGLASAGVMSGLQPIDFNLNEILNPDPNSAIIKPQGFDIGGGSIVGPVFTVPENLGELGTWTLSTTPIVYYNPVSSV